MHATIHKPIRTQRDSRATIVVSRATVRASRAIRDTQPTTHHSPVRAFELAPVRMHTPKTPRRVKWSRVRGVERARRDAREH
jgi:hypothetical protein